MKTFYLQRFVALFNNFLQAQTTNSEILYNGKLNFLICGIDPSKSTPQLNFMLKWKGNLYLAMTLKEHIDDIRKRLEQNIFKSETAVRQGIVDPLLKSLGWPTDDTLVVFPEYPVGSGHVDYALCHPSSTPRVFIEAKRVGNIEGAEQQLFEYAFHKGVPIAVLTDGQKWRFFHLMGQEDYREQKVRELDFIENNSAEITDCLNGYLNYQSVRTGEAIQAIKEEQEKVHQQKQVAKFLPEAWGKLVEEADKFLLNVVAEKTESLCGYKPTNQQALDFLKSLAERGPEQKVAYMRWWAKEGSPVSWEDVKKRIPLTESSLENILKSNAYVDCVKHLMQTTRTAEEFHEWVKNYRNMPERLGRRMKLLPEKVEQIVDEVINEHNRTSNKDNEDE